MTGLFFRILEMSATASIVILVVLFLRLCLRKAPKVYSYALWSVVLFRLLCPFAIESGLSILPVHNAPAQTEIARYEAIEAGEEYLAAYHAMGDTLNGGLDYIDVKLKPEYVDTLEEGAQQGTAALTHGEVWTLLLGSIWPAGVLVMLAHSLWSMGKLKRSLAGAVPLRDNIWVGNAVQTPFTMGLLRPVIYLPEGLGENETKYILRHEQFHIRRGDHIVKVLAFSALCLHWFNPLVWLAFHLAGQDMEMSCDEAVVKDMGTGIRADYSQSLLSLATGRRRVAATPLAFGEGDTKGRIKNVLNWKKPSVKVTVIAVLVCAAAVVVCISDPVRPVDTEQVERVYSQILSLPEGIPTIRDDETNVTEELVLGEEREQLLALLNAYTARRSVLPGWNPRAYYQENAARLEMADGTYYELRRWYTNGFSFHPAHFGEDEYDCVLAHYDSAGTLISCWKMEYNFDQPFWDWLRGQAEPGSGPAADGTEAEYAPNKRVWSFESLKPGQTIYFPENIVIGGEESIITSQITYSRTGLTLEYGLIRKDGRVHTSTVEGGSLISTYKDLSGGEYTLFIRNVDMGYEYENEATGAVSIELSSEQDYFQKSTPFVHTTAFDKVERVMVNGNIDVPDVWKAELIRLLNAEEENWQDTHIPADFALQPESGAAVRIMCEDGSWYVLERWYDDSGSNGYQTTLTWKNRDFQVIGTWIMDDDFNESYHEWMKNCYRDMALEGGEEMVLPEEVEMLGKLPGMISLVQETHHAVLEHHRSERSDENFCCASIQVLANEVGTWIHPVTGEDLPTMNYYLWVLYQEYQFTEDGLVEMGGAHIPTNITLTSNPDGSWSVLNYWEPGSGTYYAQDIRAIFPESCVEDALDSQKYITAQKRDCYEQAVSYANVNANVSMDVDAVISALLDKICSSPMESSNPKDYVADHPIEYRELKYYGSYTQAYCDRHLQAYYEEHSYGKGTNDAPEGRDLRERIMEMLLGELNL